MGDDFLLYSETAQTLFHRYAKDLPIIDYHCHLSPQEIYEDKRFRNLTDVWLSGDHYKWRALRASGVIENLITGDAPDYDKFLAWAKTVPQTIGNPLYHWTHLELRRFFGVYDVLNERTAPAIWEKVNHLLAQDDFGARGLILKSNVQVICTTDDPTDTLEYHTELQGDASFPVKVLPSFRPDKALEINRPGFGAWVAKLAVVANVPMKDYADFLRGLETRVQFFHQVGGRLSDHALDYVPFAETSFDEVSRIFARALADGSVSREDEVKFKTSTLTFLGRQYAKHGWTMQFHINALRSVNSRMRAALGPDTGFDSIADNAIAAPLSRLLDELDKTGELPKTILYSLHAAKDNDILAALIGSFQGDGIPGKIQLGSAWWFNDTIDGMTAQIRSLANMGLLSRFVGMLTDSRSFLSYPRHEYFRRILCDIIGRWAENGETPNDLELLGGIVQGVSFANANAYFGF